MSWHHIEDEDVKARKDHKCWLCGETIDKGTTYRRRVGIGDDGPITMHMHHECAKLIAAAPKMLASVQHMVIRFMKEHAQLLKEAANEIRWLRRQNELMNAKLEGVEMMAMAVASERHRGPGEPMKECVASKIDRYLTETKASD